MNFQVKSNFELKDADEKTGIVTGYASIFGNIDSDKDMIMPGAFTKTIAERGPGTPKPRIKHLWQHDSWQPIGVPVMMKEDERGLYFETKFGSDQFSQDKLKQHIDGIITELSIGYNTIKKEDSKDDKGIEFRKLTELKLWEYSSVTWGANSLTEIVSAKGESKDILAELNKRIESLNKALKNGKYSDETCEQFESELNKIQAIIKSLEIQEPVITTLKEEEPTIDYKHYLETILKTLSNE
jgi:HK97 family phage prohead protease